MGVFCPQRSGGSPPESLRVGPRRAAPRTNAFLGRTGQCECLRPRASQGNAGHADGARRRPRRRGCGALLRTSCRGPNPSFEPRYRRARRAARGGGANPAPPAQLSAADADVALPDPRILPTQRHMSIVPPPFHCHAGYAWMLALRTAQNQPNVQVRNAVR